MKIVPRVTIRTPVHPTESVAKVKVAILNLFPEVTLAEEGDMLVGEGDNLEHLRELVRNQKIRDTARGILLRSRSANVLRFTLAKQSAYIGRVNLGGVTGPLGDLEVTVEDADLDALIDHVAESTVGQWITPRDRSAGT